MEYIVWWYYEGRPKARLKRFVEGLSARIQGGKDRRKFMRELRKLEPPKYQMSPEVEKYINQSLK